MKALLGNMRWLCLPSENLGNDWFVKGQEIDKVLSQLGMDLAEESTFLLFSKAPGDVLEGKGSCYIARPVVGPKLNVEAPFHLIDWKAAPVWQEALKGESLEELLEHAEVARLKVEKEGRIAEAFNLRIRRQLKPDLVITVESLFHE